MVNLAGFSRWRVPSALWWVLALLCAALPWFVSHWASFVAMMAMQACLWLAHTAQNPAAFSRGQMLRFFGLWAMAYAVTALFLHWPLQSFNDTGDLLSALWASAAVAVLILLCWRQWPWLALIEQRHPKAKQWQQHQTAAQGYQLHPGLGLALAWLLVVGLGLAVYGKLAWAKPVLAMVLAAHFLVS